MKDFKAYLAEQKYRSSTIKGHIENIRRFTGWYNGKGHELATYQTLLLFIRRWKSRGVSKATLNLHLQSLEKYFDYLISCGIRKDNPARGLRLKTGGKRVLQDLLSEEELQEIYSVYANRPPWTFKGEKSKASHRKNVVILGFLVFQGLATGELAIIERGHIDLHRGTLYAAGTHRSASRILPLHAGQIIGIEHYLSNLPAEQNHLFSGSIRSSLTWLMTVLRRSTPVKNAQQLRHSVIMNRVRRYGIRKAQYLAGHKYVSSTERYRQEDLEELTGQLEKYHPLK